MKIKASFWAFVLCFLLVNVVHAQYGLVRHLVLDNADSTNVFETGVASKDTSFSFDMTTRGLTQGSRYPDAVTMVVPTAEDDDSTNVVSFLQGSNDGTLWYTIAATRDTIITEDGYSVRRFTGLPVFRYGRYVVEAYMAAADSVDVGPVQVLLEYKAN